jgi:membrane dipeptidase
MASMSVNRWLLGLSAVLAAGLLVPAGRQGVLAQRSSAAVLHSNAIVVDGHEHTMNRVYWEGIDPWKVQTTGVWDYARAKQGGLDVVIEQLRLEDQYNSHNYAVKQACRLIETFHRVLEANRDKMELALSSADVRRIVRSGKLAVILGIEGGFDMEGDLDVLRLFYRLGVRLVQFVNHNTTNAYADAANGEQKWGGITDYGRTVIREMNRLGILISIAHASDRAQLQIIEASAAPVAASHFGLRHFSDNPRTLPDDALEALAAKGGLVGIHSSGIYLTQKYLDWTRSRPRPRGAQAPARGARLLDQGEQLVQSPTQDYGKYIAALDARTRESERRVFLTRPWRELQQESIDAGVPHPTVEDWTNQIDYAVKLVGEDHVGIGLDMNGAGGGGELRDFDATSYPRLTEALVARGYSAARVRKILGENWLRLLDRARVEATRGK